MAKDDEFPRNQWGVLKQTIETGGAQALIDHLAAVEDPPARRQLYLFATGQLAWEEWKGKTLDAYVEVADWAIEESLRQAQAETDPEQRDRRTDLANVISYNLAAKLADCWADDPLPRGRRHFERGLAAADACLRWRTELGKGAYPFSIAWWAKGMHQISMMDAAGAVGSFRKSLDYAIQAVREQGDERAAAAEHFGVALGEGYLGIAEHIARVEGGRARYEAAVAAFEEMAKDKEKAEDAKMGLDQIRTVWSRYGG